MQVKYLLLCFLIASIIIINIIIIVIIIANTVPIDPDIIGTVLEPLAVDGVIIDVIGVLAAVTLIVEVPVVVRIDDIGVLVCDNESMLEDSVLILTINFIMIINFKL